MLLQTWFSSVYIQLYTGRKSYIYNIYNYTNNKKNKNIYIITLNYKILNLYSHYIILIIMYKYEFQKKIYNNII